MCFKIFLLLIVAASVDLKIVKTSYGYLKGAKIISDDGNHKYMFKGVPLAKPPLGELRFTQPQNPDNWEDVLNATEYRPACMANNSMSKFGSYPVSEDCLYANIFTSENCLKKSCPVIIFYHGGGFCRESPTEYSDQFILERYVNNDVIFVVPAFRLGIFGQLYFGQNEILKENLFMFDVVHGLHFLHEEIENFGGDPNRVTIMGHSTGAFMVVSLGFSELIDPDRVLFQQMIVLSAPCQFAYEELAIEHSFLISERLNCSTGNRDNTEDNVLNLLSCLRDINATEMLRVQTDMEFPDWSMCKGLIRGAPMMKLGEKIFDFKKNTSPRNVLFGTTEFEFVGDSRLITNNSIGTFLDFENPNDVFLHFYKELPNHNDWVGMESSNIFVSTRTYSEAIIKAGGEVYLFETRQKPQSTHVSDMQYFIGMHRETNHTIDMDVLDSFYSKFLVNFTKTGIPSTEWEKLDLEKMNYLEVKIDLENEQGPRMLENYHEKEMNIWFGEMMDFDKSITAKRTNLSNSQVAVQESYSFISIFSQWWFYLILFSLAVIAILAILYFKRRAHNAEEEIPLLR